jgi:hypothetical protein
MANASAEKIAVVKEVSEKLAKSNAAIITESRIVCWFVGNFAPRPSPTRR